MSPFLYDTLNFRPILDTGIWTLGHLVLAGSIPARARREKLPGLRRVFECSDERMGIPLFS